MKKTANVIRFLLLWGYLAYCIMEENEVPVKATLLHMSKETFYWISRHCGELGLMSEQAYNEEMEWLRG